MTDPNVHAEKLSKEMKRVLEQVHEKVANVREQNKDPNKFAIQLQEESEIQQPDNATTLENLDLGDVQFKPKSKAVKFTKVLEEKHNIKEIPNTFENERNYVMKSSQNETHQNDDQNENETQQDVNETKKEEDKGDDENESYVNGKEITDAEMSERNANNDKTPESPYLGPTGDYTNWLHKSEEYGVPRGETKLIIKGAKFDDEKPKKNDVRLNNIVIARHVNLDRDTSVGVALSRYNLNYIFGEKDERDLKFKSVVGTPDPQFLPKAVDLRPEWSTLLDQYDLGACVSFSVTYTIRHCIKKNSSVNFTPSPLFIYWNARQIAGYPEDEDTGLSVRDGYKSVGNYSVCSMDQWPYIVEKFSQKPPQEAYDSAKTFKEFRYMKVSNDPLLIKKSLKDGYPLSFGAALFSSFMSVETARTGIIPVPNQQTEQRIGGHCITIVGYDDEKSAYIICNSWGSTWGQNGFAFMPYEYVNNKDLCSDFWTPRFFG